MHSPETFESFLKLWRQTIVRFDLRREKSVSAAFRLKRDEVNGVVGRRIQNYEPDLK